VTRYVALLRGINVGQHKRIAMASLRDLLGDLGHTEVKTHLQSGNAVFTSAAKPVEQVARAIEERIATDTGYDVKVVVRTSDEMASVVDANPLIDSMTDPARMLVAFLSAEPAAERLAGIEPGDYEPEKFAVRDREIYLWCSGGIRDSKIVEVFSDKRLGVDVTARNWRTVTKLAELAMSGSAP
jgi:uncharacterized protein (DUF1697 family)